MYCAERHLAAMDCMEISPNSPPLAQLSIPFNIEPFLPERSLSVAELLWYRFPGPFRSPHNSDGIPVWSSLPPHDVHAGLLLSCMVPQWETMKQLLVELQKLSPSPQSFHRTTVLSCEVLLNCQGHSTLAPSECGDS